MRPSASFLLLFLSSAATTWRTAAATATKNGSVHRRDQGDTITDLKTLEAELDSEIAAAEALVCQLEGEACPDGHNTIYDFDRNCICDDTPHCEPGQATIADNDQHCFDDLDSVNNCYMVACQSPPMPVMCATIAVACMEPQVAVPYVDEQGCEYYVCEDVTPREECSLTFIADPCPDCEGWVANEDCTGATCVDCRETLPPEYQCEDPAPCDPSTQTTVTSTDEFGCVVHTCYEVCNTLTAEPTECTGAYEVRQIDLGACTASCRVMCPQPVCEEGTTFILQDRVTCEPTCTETEVVATRQGRGGGGGKKGGDDSAIDDRSTTTTKGGGKKGGNKKNLRW